jgi:type II secretory pathway pseudopilin PulG
MRISIKSQVGVTLVEILLVIVIGLGLLMLGVRQYQSYRVDADALQLRNNVDMMLQAVARFYFANCNGTYNPNGSPPFKPGLLHPNSAPKNPFLVNIQTQLVNAGYLSASPFPINPIVNSGSPVTQFGGYVAQLNQTTQTRLVCSTGNAATGVTAGQGCSSTLQTGTIIIWLPQVAILIKDTTKVKVYANLLNADCTSSLAGTTVAPCSSKKPGNYLVWQRTPSMPSTTMQGNSSELGLQGVLSSGNLMYQTYSTGYLGSVNGVTSPANQPQYFLCGG